MTKKANRLWLEDEEISKQMKKRRAEESDRRKRAESNPLIWFPAQMLAAGGNLTMSTDQSLVAPKGKAYNVITRQYPQGILDVRDQIDEAYRFYLDVLKDPWHVAYDELLSVNEDDLFLDWPNEIDLRTEFRKWEIQQVLNRTPKPTDSKRLRIATFIMGLLEDEDFARPPDEIYTYSRWYTVYHSLHEHWRFTIGKLLDFAVEQATKPNATNGSNVTELLNEIIKGQKRQDQLLKGIQSDSRAAAVNSEIAASRNLKELKGKSMGGRKGAAIVKAERGKDIVRKAILSEAKNMLNDWDKKYPNRHKPPKDLTHSNAAAFRIVANKHNGANGEPIMSAGTIGRALRRENGKGEARGKYARMGRKRGKYKTGT